MRRPDHTWKHVGFRGWKRQQGRAVDDRKTDAQGNLRSILSVCMVAFSDDRRRRRGVERSRPSWHECSGASTPGTRIRSRQRGTDAATTARSGSSSERHPHATDSQLRGRHHHLSRLLPVFSRGTRIAVVLRNSALPRCGHDGIPCPCQSRGFAASVVASVSGVATPALPVANFGSVVRHADVGHLRRARADDRRTDHVAGERGAAGPRRRTESGKQQECHPRGVERGARRRHVASDPACDRSRGGVAGNERRSAASTPGHSSAWTRTGVCFLPPMPRLVEDVPHGHLGTRIFTRYVRNTPQDSLRGKDGSLADQQRMRFSLLSDVPGIPGALSALAISSPPSPPCPPCRPLRRSSRAIRRACSVRAPACVLRRWRTRDPSV
ncbi:hypothetical protein DFR24_1128 [Panacagrimonas perspica]|uniref:Uncharacterized protein n=1 Tax=Panacagrimonas perspica TaxID=381431 RepID=A0A4R7PCJ2_9GAMM|nr:hypothetical protein DFR24_1128 [Panacagrimonas perspica]